MALDDTLDFTAALRRSIRGMRIAYSPNLDVFPVEPEVAEIVERAVRAFEEAGAHFEIVKIGIRKTQREFSDLWGRLMMPLKVAGFDGLGAQGDDMFGAAPAGPPPENL